jgi:DNA-binding transcriptional MerR regulator
MSSPPARGYFGISEVLAQLRADFPDISVSKIRFLETEGLISPARSPAGYRRFGPADVDRLRRILAAQRDQYLPLRVIKERLAAADQQPAAQASRGDTDELASISPAQAARAAAPDRLLTRRELVDAAGMSDALLTELETFGLLRNVGRHYSADAVEVASMAVALAAYGVEARHLPAVRAAAERESTMIESLVAPILRQRGPGARDLAGRTAGDVASLVLRLHGALMRAALAEAGLVAPAGQTGPEFGAADRQTDGASARQRARRQAAGGVSGASA